MKNKTKMMKNLKSTPKQKTLSFSLENLNLPKENIGFERKLNLLKKKLSFESDLINFGFKQKWFSDKSGFWFEYKRKLNGIRFKISIEDDSKGDYYIFLQAMTYGITLTDNKKTGYERVSKLVKVTNITGVLEQLIIWKIIK